MSSARKRERRKKSSSSNACRKSTRFFLDAPNIAGNNVFGDKMRHAFKTQQWTTNSDCEAAQRKAGGDVSDCVFPAVVAPFVKARKFYFQSTYDSWQLRYVLGAEDDSFAPCTHSAEDCSEEQWRRVQTFHKQLVDTLVNSLSAADGFVLHSCWTHDMIKRDERWYNFNVGGERVADAFQTWWNSNASTSSAAMATSAVRLMDCERVFGHGDCNPACTHGSLPDESEHERHKGGKEASSSHRHVDANEKARLLLLGTLEKGEKPSLSRDTLLVVVLLIVLTLLFVGVALSRTSWLRTLARRPTRVTSLIESDA